MPVHPSQGHHENTLANALAYRFASRGEHFVFRAVNRLDRDTTGLLLIAKHKISGAFLSAMTAKNEIRREYLAIVAGKPEESGTIDLPIARKDGSTIERCIDMDHRGTRRHPLPVSRLPGQSRLLPRPASPGNGAHPPDPGPHESHRAPTFTGIFYTTRITASSDGRRFTPIRWHSGIRSLGKQWSLRLRCRRTFSFFY